MRPNAEPWQAGDIRSPLPLAMAIAGLALGAAACIYVYGLLASDNLGPDPCLPGRPAPDGGRSWWPPERECIGGPEGLGRHTVGPGLWLPWTVGGLATFAIITAGLGFHAAGRGG